MRAPALSCARRKTALWIAIGAGLLLLAGANAHLVYVAVTSQPDCVTHVRQGETGTAAAGYSAARSSCSLR